MPESGKTDRTHWEASHRYNYTGIDRFFGDRCERMVLITSQKKGKEIAALLNDAYMKGRQEMMKELLTLFDSPGGQFYINQMFMAFGNGLHDVPQITQMVTERIDVGAVVPQVVNDRLHDAPNTMDHEPSLGCCAEHFNSAKPKGESI